DGRWYPEFFRINFSRCIFCGLCEEACPTTAIQLTPDFELGEYRFGSPLVAQGDDMTLFTTLLVLIVERLFKLGEHWQLDHRLEA
ncbi:regulatory signaling modulator protein AmpE, partial [Salmonella enterica subsp. enterica serovar Kentucky]|nr:regulatory signaling modulator protein AmpE [Salmonella enterica subsp. enterica serovar Kentucky]